MRRKFKKCPYKMWTKACVKSRSKSNFILKKFKTKVAKQYLGKLRLMAMSNLAIKDVISEILCISLFVFS